MTTRGQHSPPEPQLPAVALKRHGTRHLFTPPFHTTLGCWLPTGCVVGRLSPIPRKLLLLKIWPDDVVSSPSQEYPNVYRQTC